MKIKLINNKIKLTIYFDLENILIERNEVRNFRYWTNSNNIIFLSRIPRTISTLINY